MPARFSTLPSTVADCNSASRFPQPAATPVVKNSNPFILLRSNYKGADARRQTVMELAKSLGGVLDTATVLREFLNSTKYPETA
jgi:hypothetical protein